MPETPWYYGRRGNKEGAFKSMRRLYSNIPDYDYEEEYGIIIRTIAHERELLAEVQHQSWSAVFRGLNGVRWRGQGDGQGLTTPARNECSSYLPCARANKSAETLSSPYTQLVSGAQSRGERLPTHP